jgi:FOG: Transposase and inactivated derivatives
MTAKEVIGLIPQRLFDFLSVETQVDYQVKKLNGEMIFKLILFSMLENNKLSLRVMESFLESAQFKQFSQSESLTSKYNSIRDRICTINSVYFERLQEEIFKIYNEELREEKSLSKCDSTYVSIASKLICIGMKIGRKTDEKTQIKYSVNLKGSLPSSIKVFTDQSFVSEDLALSEIINQTNSLTDNIVVFDRGLQSRKRFDTFTQDNKLFVTRANANVKAKSIEEKEICVAQQDSSITIKSDIIGYLYDKKTNKTRYKYRIIKGIINASGEEIVFVSNLLEEDAYFIAQLYKQRWEIEVFFKFIKQHLNVSHLVSRNENGIKVMIYMTMILATLIIVYKKKNGIKGFKIAKLKFGIELENEIIKSIVILCGGNPNKAAHLFGYD